MDRFAVAIIGSGPAGLSAAARAAARGMPHVLLEKSADHLSDTIFKYQKGKHVMATPSGLVLRSDADFDAGKRETVLGTWDRQIAEAKVNVRLRRRSEEDRGRERRLHADARRRIDDRGRDGDPGDRHAGQSQPGPRCPAPSCRTSSTSSTTPPNMSTSISS